MVPRREARRESLSRRNRKVRDLNATNIVRHIIFTGDRKKFYPRFVSSSDLNGSGVLPHGALIFRKTGGQTRDKNSRIYARINISILFFFYHIFSHYTRPIINVAARGKTDGNAIKSADNDATSVPVISRDSRVVYIRTSDVPRYVESGGK